MDGKITESEAMQVIRDEILANLSYERMWAMCSGIDGRTISITIHEDGVQNVIERIQSDRETTGSEMVKD